MVILYNSKEFVGNGRMTNLIYTGFGRILCQL
jgi:hypothetical protein